MSMARVVAAAVFLGVLGCGATRGEEVQADPDGLLFYGEKDAKASSLTAEKVEVLKEIKPHDIITVRIKDVYSFIDTAKLNTDSKDTTDFAINKFFNITEGAGGSNQVANPTATSKPEINLTSERKKDNSGNTSKTQSVSAMITGHVVEVYPNHTFSFEATQTTEHDENKTTMTLFGIMRIQDVGPDNIVAGERLDGKQFSIKTDGPTSRVAKRGWFSKLLDVVWPF